MNNKSLHLFVGPSASGKTSIADALEKCGYKQVKSYTTRKPRYEGENNHTFITKDEFDKLENMIAYTEYDNNFYCSTKEQLDKVDIYVVDVPGVKTLIDNYNTERPIYIYYFDVDLVSRVKRMRNRGDSDTAIIDRIINDEQYDWYDALVTLRDYAQLFTNKNIELTYIDANVKLEELLELMKINLGG